MLCHLLLGHAALLLALARPHAAPAAEFTGEPLGAIYAVCTPSTVKFGGNQPQSAAHPIVAALAKAGPGSVIEIAPGAYRSFSIGFSKPNAFNAGSVSGRPGQPITLRASGEVRILADEKTSDTIAIAQQVPCAHITFEGFTIEAGYRAGVMFYKVGPDQTHDGFRFVDCSIRGGFDHATAQGRNSKWGVWGHKLNDFEFRGVRAPAVVRDIRAEHAFYLQNSSGLTVLENVHGIRLGRTFAQFTARPSDGPPGSGTIRVERCYVEDACIAAGDNYKGGSALTLAGRHAGTVIFKNNVVRSGFKRELRHLTRLGAPYGTGAFVAWDAGGERNQTLVLENNDFEFAEGCGDRPLVQISGCRSVRLVGKNRFMAGASPALVLDLEGNNPILNFSADATTQVRGDIRLAGKPLKLAELLAYKGSAPAAPAGK